MNENEKKEFWRNETIAFLALASIKGVGYWKLRKVAENGKSFKELLKAESSAGLSKILMINLPDDTPWEEYQVKLWSQGLEQARFLNNQGIVLIFSTQEIFPSNLKKIHDAPYWLFVQGSIENLHAKSVSIVGTRAPSDDGILLTKIVVASLAEKGIPTISGLASGIDQTAHIDSIRYGIPTVAVLGNGLLVEYPRGSDSLKHQILASGGSVVTEYLPSQTYSAENFVRRNRIQAALCETLIPIEWKIKSGTAHTVNFAVNYEKKISGVYLPGNVCKRNDLQFIKTFGGTAFELPCQINELIRFILSEVSPLEPSQKSLDL